MLTADHELPGDARCLVSERHGGKLRGFALDQRHQPGRGVSTRLPRLLDHCGGTEHQGAAQGLVASARDDPQSLLAGGGVVLIALAKVSEITGRTGCPLSGMSAETNQTALAHALRSVCIVTARSAATAPKSALAKKGAAMKIAIMATGGVGGYFGARLAAAGEEVRFIARGAHLAALRANGLTLKSANGDLHLEPVAATDDPASIGPVDIVLFAGKQYDTETAAKLIRPLIGAETAVITLQNGMDQKERLAAIVGRDHVMGGAAYILGAEIAAPGIITHVGKVARIAFGECDGRSTARAERFLAACRNAGIDAALSADIAKELWSKFTMLSAFSGVSTMTRKPAGAIMADPDTRKLMTDAMAEAAAVGRAKGIDLGDDYVPRQAVFYATSVAPDAKASMLLDLENGRRLELEWLSGAVARFGDELNVPTPTHHFLYAALKLHAGGKG